MNKFIITMLVLSGVLYSAEPWIDLQPFPSKNQLEIITDNDELYASKLLEYYKLSLIFETQLNYLGFKPQKSIITPTLEELSDGESKTLLKYYNLAKTLEDQIRKSPNGIYNEKYNELKQRNKANENELFILKDSIYWLSIENSKLNFYKNNFPKLIAEIDSLRFRNDSLLLSYNLKLWKHDEKLRKMYLLMSYKKPLVTAGFTLNQFFFNHKGIENDLSGGVFLLVSPESVFGYGKYFDLWAEYNIPRWKTTYNSNQTPVNGVNEFSTNIYNVGLSLSLPISDIFHIKSFVLNLSLGGGLFWGNTRQFNTPIPKSDWDGLVIKTSLSLVNYSHIFPVGAYVGFNFFNFNKPLVFNQVGGPINLGNLWLSNLQFGLTFPLVTSSFIIK